MARLKSLKATAKSGWDEYGGWIILALVAYTLFSFRKVFSTLGDAAGAGVESVVAGAQADAAAKAKKVKVQASTGTKTNYTDAQIAAFDSDANSLAGYFGTLVGGGWRLFADNASAFTLLKQKYSRLRLLNNLPVIQVGKAKNGQAQYKTVSVENASCVKNSINWKVLIPAYKDASGGRNLESDIRVCITDSDRQKFLKWIL